MSVPVVSEAQFEAEVLRSELPVLLEFYAELSGPCKRIEPDLVDAARELEGKAKVFKVDAEKSRRLGMSLRVQAVPTFVIFSGGRPVAMEQGVKRKKEMLEMIEPFLPRAEGAIRALELVPAMKDGQASPVDTRDARSFARAHIPGATNLPAEEIPTRLAELHLLPGTPVLYCRSGDKAKEVSDSLAEQGMPVAFLEGGFLAWEAEGLPIERD